MSQIEDFKSITGLQDSEAMFYLESTGYDVESAIQMYFSSAEQGTHYQSTGDKHSPDNGATEKSLSSVVPEEVSVITAAFPSGFIHEAWRIQVYKFDNSHTFMLIFMTIPCFYITRIHTYQI